MGDLIAPVGPALAPYQPAQRYCVVDERRAGEDDLKGDNLMAAVVRLEQSRSPADLLQAVDTLRARLAEPGDHELRRQAASRFDEDTASRLSEALAQVADPERLAEVGEWLVRCDTGAELLARVAKMAGGRRGAGA